MSPQAEKETESAPDEHSPLLDAARKVLLAGIGAVALAQGEIEDFVNKLVERGEIAEKDGNKLIRDLVERSKKETTQAAKELDSQVAECLQHMNLPTRADAQNLSAKIAALTAQIDKLKK